MRIAALGAAIAALFAALVAEPQPPFPAHDAALMALREAYRPQVVLPPVPEMPLPGPPLIQGDDTEALHAAQVARHVEPEPITIELTVEGEVQPVERSFEDTAMGDGNVEAWRGVVEGAFGDLGAGAVNTALCLMVHESGGNPDATNPSSGASGLMQVLPSWADHFGFARDDLYDPTTNLWISRQLYDDGGWGHWSPWNRGECH